MACETPKKKDFRSNKNCCVPGCDSRGSDNLTMHLFPKNEDLREEWAKVLKIGKPVGNFMYVCCLHFERNEYILPNVPSKKKSLKKNALPSLNLPMPYTCCVIGCRSNHPFERIPVEVFPFPTNQEFKKKWQECIGRRYFVPKRTSRVCVKHFEDRYIVRDRIAILEDGSIDIVPRKKLALTDDAIPTVFGNDDSDEEEDEGNEEDQEQELLLRARLKHRKMRYDEIRIESFDDFKEFVMDNPPDNWIFAFSDDNLSLMKLSFDDCPKVFLAVKFFSDHSIQIWKNEVLIPPASYLRLLGASGRCDTYQKYEALMRFLEFQTDDGSSIYNKMERACRLLNECLVHAPGSVNDTALSFLCRQLESMLEDHDNQE